ncbi:hypothetical protein L6164_002637 [Bauhinia variegata]|uniref:Uncharacterized protein n=1 Tax=Bauhinia variegata TaxID=167791 RepID=A0ACB9PYU3_BAUVA|nr:hypothetical protein L6164_002637 [Bauhinia variegata]
MEEYQLGHNLATVAMFLACALNSADFVYDTDNQPLKNGGSYHIISAIKLNGWRGGLELGRTGNEIYPHSVVQARSDIFMACQQNCHPYLKFFTQTRVCLLALISQKYRIVSYNLQNGMSWKNSL